MDPQPHLESSDAVMEMAMAASALTEAERVQKTQQMEAQEAAEMERAIEASCTPSCVIAARGRATSRRRRSYGQASEDYQKEGYKGSNRGPE
jgi:hypothetical protein